MYVVEALKFLDEAIISDDLEISSTPKVVRHHLDTWSCAVYISRSPEVAHLKKKIKSV